MLNVRAQAAKRYELEFSGVIDSQAEPGDTGFIRPHDVLAFFGDLPRGADVTLYFNSPGGSGPDGFQIANRLQTLIQDGTIKHLDCVVEGICASAATFPFLLGQRRAMHTGAKLMIHNPWAVIAGDADRVRSGADMLQKTTGEAAAFYAATTKLSEDAAREAMAAETWYTPAEAVDSGFATEAIAPMAIAACLPDAWREKLQHIPDDLATVDPRQAAAEREERIRRADPANWGRVVA